MEYKEEEFLPLSGIQHFVFCKRQWALIHIEQQWQENVRTVEGHLMHERVHDEFLYATRNGVKSVRGVAVHSRALGIYGVCDVVEFCEDGKVVPVEYKKGAPKESDADLMQLVLQTICLEEMMCIKIPTAYLYYGETRHRMQVEITEAFKEKAFAITKEMHDYYSRAYTPKVKPSKSCNACSLKNICLPKLYTKNSVKQYIKENIGE